MNDDAYSPTTKDVYNVMSMLYPDGSKDYPNSSYYLDSFLQEYNTNDYDIFYIIHDKDVDNNGEFLKTHIHFAIRRRNGGTFSLAKYMRTLHVSINNCKHIDNFNGYLQYVLHMTEKSHEDGKYEYPLSDLWSNFDPLPLISNKDTDRYKTEFAVVRECVDYMKDNGYDWDLLLDYVGYKGYYKIFKQNIRVIERLVHYLCS